MQASTRKLREEIGSLLINMKATWCRMQGTWSDRQCVHGWNEIQAFQLFLERLDLEQIDLLEEHSWAANRMNDAEKNLFRKPSRPAELECARFAGLIEGFARIGQILADIIEERREKED